MTGLAQMFPAPNRRHHKQLVTLAAYAALVSYRGEWASAIQVTDMLVRRLRDTCNILWPWSYRPVAFALRRLVNIGFVQEQIVTYRGTARSKEQRREYRILQGVQAHPRLELFPTVMPVAPGSSRRVHGRDWRG